MSREIPSPRRIIRLAAAMLSVACIASLGHSLPAASVQAEDWTPRLEALSPDDPLAYFELAEEIVDVTDEPEQIDLARRLFKLAGVLAPERLGRSVCLALADLEPIEHERARYLALAAMLDEAAGLSPWSGARPAETVSRTIALDVSEALGHFRQGNGPRALSTLRDSDALSFLEREEHLLPYGLKRFVADCNIYRGGRRPTLARSDVVRMLRAEDALLNGAQRGWQSDLLLTQASPLVEVDPTRLPTALGLSAIRPLYRNGRWIAADAAVGDEID